MMLTVLIPVKADGSVRRTLFSLTRQNVGQMEVLVLRNGTRTLKPNTHDWNGKGCSGMCCRTIGIYGNGKGHALNIGIAQSASEYVAVIDADCELAPDALKNAMKCFDNTDVVAVGGRLKTLSGGSLLGEIQMVEYEKAFNISRLFFHSINADCLISGAFGIFRRRVFKLVHGYREDTVGEDMDLVLRIQSLLYKKGRNIIGYARDAICYTRTPDTLKRLLRQRDRWQRGLLDSLLYSRKMIANPRYSSLGMVAMPYQLVMELLRPFFLFASVVLFLVGQSQQCCLSMGTVGAGIHLFSSFCVGYIIFEILLALVADVMGDGIRSKSEYWFIWVPIITLMGFCVQFIVSFARVYGMLSFPTRKMVW